MDGLRHDANTNVCSGFEEFVAILSSPLIVHIDEKIAFANTMAAKLLTGDSRINIVGRPVSDFLSICLAFSDPAEIAFRDNEKYPVFTACCIAQPTGSVHEIGTISASINYFGKPAVLTFLQDVTELRNAERKSKEADWCYQSLSQSSLVGVFLYSRERIFYVNSYMENLLGYKPEELYRMSFYDLVYPEDRDYSIEGEWEGDGPGQKKKQLRMLTKEGNIIYAEIYSSALECGNEDMAVLGTLLDITHLKKAEEQIRFLAYHDALTNLPNRRLFNENAARLIERCRTYGGKFGVMFIDLDRFKSVNDTFGHSFGDEILKQASERLRTCVDAGGDVYRHGGDEFVVVLGNADRAKCSATAQKIVRAFNRPFRQMNYEVFTTTSIGISIFPDDGESLETLMVNADAAMYYAKVRGKCNYQFFNSVLRKNMMKALELENGLRRALSKKEFCLHYQPQFELYTGRLAGIEALARWKHPVLGEVSPSDFIPRAEDTGLILPIGEWILETACRQNKFWQNSGYARVPVAVNVSGYQLKHSDFAGTVQRILGKTQLEPRYLVVEITEGVMQDVKKTSRIVNDLRAIGVKVAIDDFGKGYSSLSVLKSLPIDILKIDQSFIYDAASNPNTATLLKFIIDMGHLLNSEIIAEGIENEQQALLLKQEKCNIGQGYYFNRPMAAENIEELLKKS